MINILAAIVLGLLIGKLLFDKDCTDRRYNGGNPMPRFKGPPPPPPRRKNIQK